MVRHSYFRENINVLTQFCAAFDDCFVFRYDKNFVAKEKIVVRYVMGPKQRVLYDIVNQAKNLTLPVVAMDQKNVKRDSTRIQFKDQKITSYNSTDNTVIKLPSPIPVTMDVDVSIVANYKEDIDQIVSNFIPWCNPYFIIAWKIPEEFGLDHIEELRTEVTWNGSVDYETPINIDKGDKYKIIGNTTFNLKGWLFPAAETPAAPIYVVRTNFVSVSSGAVLHLDNYPSLSASDSTEVILISAYPEISDTFYRGIPFYDMIVISKAQNHTFTFYGKRFGFSNSWYLSGQHVAPIQLTEIDTARFPTISAYKIPQELVVTHTDNIVTISLSTNYLSAGKFTFVTANSAGWVRMEDDVIVI